MKYLSQNIIISLVSSVLLTLGLYYMNKQNPETNKMELKTYVKYSILSAILIYLMILFKSNYGNMLSNSTNQSGGSSSTNTVYSPNISVSNPPF